MDEFIPCRLCAKKSGPKPGFYYVETPSQKLAVECTCHKKYMKDRDFFRYAPEAGIWPEALKYSPERDYAGQKSIKDLHRFITYVHNFNDFASNQVYIWGPNGTQKTTLAQWAGATLLHDGLKVKYVLMQNLLSTLTAGFENDEEKKSKIDKLHKVDLLIIDEAFSKDKVTLYESGYQLPFLDRFLRERAEINKKGILYISNKAPSSIESQKFSKSIQDFVERNTRQSCLYFEDNYIKEKSSELSIGSIFD